MTIAWPDGSELPKIEPLSPDPDIEVAEQSTDAAVEALPGQEETDSGVGTKLVDADIARVGRQVELAFPRGTDAIAEKDAIAERFAGLSALKSFDNDQDNLAQIVRRARTDRELLVNILRIHGYYDAQVYHRLADLPRLRKAILLGRLTLKRLWCGSICRLDRNIASGRSASAILVRRAMLLPRCVRALNLIAAIDQFRPHRSRAAEAAKRTG
jgi:hypothetical protein